MTFWGHTTACTCDKCRMNQYPVGQTATSFGVTTSSTDYDQSVIDDFLKRVAIKTPLTDEWYPHNAIDEVYAEMFPEAQDRSTNA